MKLVLIDVLRSIYTTIITNIQKSSGKSSGWIINSDCMIHPLAGSSYIKFPKELDQTS